MSTHLPLAGRHRRGVDSGDLQVINHNQNTENHSTDDLPILTSTTTDSFSHASIILTAAIPDRGGVTYPKPALENGIEGRVLLMIYLEKTGEVTRIAS